MGQDNIVEFGLAMAGREYIEPFSEKTAERIQHATAAESVEMLSTLVSPPDQAVLGGAIGGPQRSRSPAPPPRSRPAPTEDAPAAAHNHRRRLTSPPADRCRGAQQQ